MIVADASAFRAACAAGGCAPAQPATARAVMLVEPTGIRLSTESATDNHYMDAMQRIDPLRALEQHRVLAEAIRRHARLPVAVFEGGPETPDAVFPNNVFATVPGRLAVGAMRHAERRREAARADIPAYFEREHGYAVVRLDPTACVSELTGPLVIDRARGIGYYGRTERLDHAGVVATHAALGLALGFEFALAPGEYHTNVIMAVLAGRALVAHRGSFADPGDADAIAAVYAPHVIWLSDAEKAAFAGNCIALADDAVYMSATAERALTAATRHALDRAGFTLHAVALDEIEKAGGSLRCCVAEIF